MATTVRASVLKWAQAELARGVREEPAGSNSGPRVRWYQAACDLARSQPTGWAWCVAFLQRGFLEVGHPLGYRTASVGELLRWARAQGWEVTAPAPGDLACFDFDDTDGPRRGDWPDHIGIVESVSGTGLSMKIVCIEGNTSPSNWSNGGQVARQVRYLRHIEGFIRVPGTLAPPPAPKPPAPKPDPEEQYLLFLEWRRSGGLPENRPLQLGVQIPAEWWDRVKRDLAPVGPVKTARWEIVGPDGKPVAWNKDLATLIKWQARKQAERLGSILIRRREV